MARSINSPGIQIIETDLSLNQQFGGATSVFIPGFAPQGPTDEVLLVSTIYNIEISKKNISEIFSISDVTISKTYRKIYPYHKIIMNNEVTELILEKKNNIEKQNSTMKNEDLIVTEKFSDIDSDSDNDSELSENSITLFYYLINSFVFRDCFL
jgi:hypothetical protein